MKQNTVSEILLQRCGFYCLNAGPLDRDNASVRLYKERSNNCNNTFVEQLYRYQRTAMQKRFSGLQQRGIWQYFT